MKVAVTNLDAVAIITGTGLKREKTRDEIYCQICKQLVDNPNRYSHARAWIMLALCAGVFLPSPAFEKVLRNFIKNTGPPGYLPYLMQRFARAETAFQPRTHTVSSVEVHSAFTGEKIQIRVHFYFSSMVVLADGATTPAEVVASVKRHPDLAEEYGFKLFILGKEATTVGTQISRMDAFECVPGKLYKSSIVLWRAYILRDIYRLQPRVTSHDNYLRSLSLLLEQSTQAPSRTHTHTYTYICGCRIVFDGLHCLFSICIALCAS